MSNKDDHDLPKSEKKSGPGNTPGTPDPDAKNRPETAGVGESLSDKKNTPPPDKQPHTPNKISNRDQDPDHPANNTPSLRGDPAPRPVAEGVTVPPEELLTEQEKAAVGSGVTGDTTAGVGPVSPAEHTTGPVETIEDQGIGPRTPYPTGDPPPAREETTLSQGIKGDADKPHTGPNERKGPVGPRTDPPDHDHPVRRTGL